LLKAETVESAILSARVIASEDAQIAGSVRVGAPDGFGTIFLAPLLADLSRRHSQLNVEIFAIPRRFSLSKREAEIAISLSIPQQIRVVSRRLTDYHLYVYASRSYLESRAPIKGKEDLLNHPFIGYSEEIFAPEVDYLDVIGPDVGARIRSMSLVAQAYAALGGAGLCILPAFFEQAFPSLIPVLPDQVSLTRSFHVHIHEDHRQAPAIRAVANFIVEQVEGHAALFREKHVGITSSGL
jgi:DNA-binding transcriptional LysR family regulator